MVHAEGNHRHVGENPLHAGGNHLHVGGKSLWTTAERFDAESVVNIWEKCPLEVEADLDDAPIVSSLILLWL